MNTNTITIVEEGTATSAFTNSSLGGTMGVGVFSGSSSSAGLNMNKNSYSDK